MTSPKEKCSLLMQKDGNLVFYQSNDKEILWETESKNQGEELKLLEDGILVLYDRNKNKLFSTPSSYNGEYLMVNDDKNIVIYGKQKEIKWSLSIFSIY